MPNAVKHLARFVERQSIEAYSDKHLAVVRQPAQLHLYSMNYPIALLVLLSGPAHAQPTTLTGRVLDAKTNAPIPYATVCLRNEARGSLTDTDGSFKLAGRAKPAPDSLIVTALGYGQRAVEVKQGDTQGLVIGLSHTPFSSICFTTRGSKIKPLTLGSRATNPGEGMIQGLTDTQYALFIKNEKQKELGTIRSVSFYIGENGFPREPFRIRVYRAEVNDSVPATDLLTESVIRSAPRGGQWYTVDLTTYNLPAPKEGFFVAMEWLMGAGILDPCPTSYDGHHDCGQTLRPTFEFKESCTWRYTIGKGWSKVTLANNQGKFYNAMIKAEVDQIR